MKKILLSICLLAAMNIGALPQLYAQQWTEPVNISNLGGYSMDPDMVIDHKGVIHVVWSYQNSAYHWLIIYCYSEDDGNIWSEPLDLLQNTDQWMLQPHIACDSKNNLYVTYTHDGNSWTPEGRLIKMLSWDGNQWSEPIVVSEGMPGSHYNHIHIDHKNRIVVSWDFGPTGDNYFRFFENEFWTDAFCPYPGGTEIYGFVDAVIDKNNSMHWIGASMGYAYPGQERLQYFYYNNFENFWYPPVMPVKDTIQVGQDIALSNNEKAEITFRKKSTIAVGVTTDSTMHLKKEENLWSDPNLVSGTDKRQEGQQIVVDQNNEVHIVETEFYASSVSETQLVHYSKNGNNWQKKIIDYSKHMCHFPKLIFSNNQLYVIYYKSEVPLIGNLHFSKYDIITNIKEETKQTPELKIYPNPGSGIISIEFENSSRELVDLSVYDISGKLVSVLTHKTLTPGMQRFVWEAHSTTGQKVKPGTYLVKLTKGDSSATQVVEIIK